MVNINDFKIEVNDEKGFNIVLNVNSQLLDDAESILHDIKKGLLSLSTYEEWLKTLEDIKDKPEFKDKNISLEDLLWFIKYNIEKPTIYYKVLETYYKKEEK